ncbi:hypothetical protein D3229_09860 [Leucobacter aridicollis]|nr:hypothetical protein [Leucobacter aridicollis]
MVVLMCQYQPTCPTTRHREGTTCPERVRIQKHNQKVQKRNAEVREHNRKVDLENRVGAVVAIVAVVAVAALAVWWFLLR